MHTSSTIRSLLLLAAAALFAACTDEPTAPASTRPAGAAPHAARQLPGAALEHRVRPRGTREVAIVFRDTVRESDLAWVRSHAPAGPHYRFRGMPGLLVYVPERALPALRANPRVRYASFGHPIAPTAETVGWNYQDAPQGHRFAMLEWAASQGAQGTDGSGVGVAIIDTGVDCYNLSNLDIYNACGMGWSFVTSDPDPYHDAFHPPWSNTVVTHGTAVASQVIAARNNGIGIKGGAPGATIYPLKIFSSDPNDGGSTCNRSAAAIDFATTSLSTQVAVMNLSYHSTNPYLTYESYVQDCQAERDAIRLAINVGRFIAAAAGNDPNAPVGYPANLPGVAAVGGLSCCVAGTPTIWTGTTWGPEISLWGSADDVPTVGPNGVVSNQDGTSFATPQVSAAAAVVFSKYSDIALHGQCVLIHLKNTARSAHGGLPMVDAYAAWGIDLPWSERWCTMPREM